MPAASVILTTYNKPQDLIRVLEGFRKQTFKDFEICVCDDGSGPETRETIETYAASVPFPVHHCWQEDSGFRAAASRNNGGRKASGETLVFVDGDCVPFPDFLSVHVGSQGPRSFMAGERYLLEREESDAIGIEDIASGAAYASAPKREIKRVAKIRRKDIFYRLSGLKPERPRLMTSNCSVPRAAFEAVNGLDERYEGWGQEDEDLRRRLVRQGYKPGTVIGAANVLHLWHRSDPTFLGTRKQSPNWNYYHRGFQLSRCRRGLTARPLGDLAAVVRGPDALVAAAREVLGLGAADDRPLELEVLIDDGEGPPLEASGDAEVTVRICAALPTPDRARGADWILAPGAEPAGGELPTEDHPPVPKPLASVGVRAISPLPDGPLGEATFAAAAELLDTRL